MPYSGKRTTYPAKGCRIQEKEQPIQRKDAVFREKDNLSSERMSYPGKGQSIQRKVVVSWERSNNASNTLMYSARR